MNWIEQVDRIYVINLPRRADRRDTVTKELKRHAIPFEFWIGHDRINGALGLHETMMEIFDISIRNDWKSILIFEDDVHFINDPNETMPKAISELPEDWDMLYMGCNIPDPQKISRHSSSLLNTTRSLATHAVMYSNRAMKKAVTLPNTLPIDMALANYIQPDGKTYCTLPLLCVQLPGYSDIERRNTDYRVFIQERYMAATINLFSQK